MFYFVLSISVWEIPDHSDAVFWVMRNMTNSAGFTGAIPIWQISRPLSISSWVIVVGPHYTKKASEGVDPARAPSRQQVARNASMVRVTRLHRAAELCSKTTQLVLALMDSST